MDEVRKKEAGSSLEKHCIFKKEFNSGNFPSDFSLSLFERFFSPAFRMLPDIYTVVWLDAWWKKFNEF